jgi:hypothetical protein
VSRFLVLDSGPLGLLTHPQRAARASLEKVSDFVHGFIVPARLLRFGQLDVSGDPVLASPTWDRWFNTSVFRQATPFTPRTNPFQYDGLTGPGNWNLDTTLSKNFNLTERFKLEFRLEGYNLTNSVMPGNPDLGVLAPRSGASIRR